MRKTTTQKLVAEIDDALARGDRDTARTLVKKLEDLTIRRRRAHLARNRKANDQMMSDLGLTKVKGNLGGTYWE